MYFVITKGFSHHAARFAEIIYNFKNRGTLIGDGQRNIIKHFESLDIKVNVKSFKQPNNFNQIAYKYFRKSKARRSFEYATMLIDKGFKTPQPLAYLETSSFLGLKASYYISEHLDRLFLLREVLEDVTFKDRTTIINGYTAVIYQLHQHGFEFIDNSSGNILIEKKGEKYDYYLVDLNRMNFHKNMSISKKLKNFARLSNDAEVIGIVSKEYARLSNTPEAFCSKTIVESAQFASKRYRLKRKLKFWKLLERG